MQKRLVDFVLNTSLAELLNNVDSEPTKGLEDPAAWLVALPRYDQSTAVASA